MVLHLVMPLVEKAKIFVSIKLTADFNLGITVGIYSALASSVSLPTHHYRPPPQIVHMLEEKKKQARTVSCFSVLPNK